MGSCPDTDIDPKNVSLEHQNILSMAGLRYFRGKNYFTTNHFVFFIYSVLSVHQLQSIIKKKTANWQLTKCELVKFEWTFCWDFGGEIKDKRIRSHCLFRGQFSTAP